MFYGEYYLQLNSKKSKYQMETESWFGHATEIYSYIQPVSLLK